ncbi:unnamed protein product [Urochloa decumbens]|uniref:Bifunctional inhibitor/plant lipid transfer protein/seed storage helical domain-containing protein n=1 Tax=Urochloa decumbens TaxID=240449 RepID=A0ABC9DCT0_9POAL
MTSSAANKKHQMAVMLCLALVVVAAVADVKPACQVPNNVTACVQQILDFKEQNQGKLLSPDCCKQLTEQFGCACVLRNALKEANLLDIQKPFCVKGTACE